MPWLDSVDTRSQLVECASISHEASPGQEQEVEMTGAELVR
jgi:hypothetical protein